jgi:hypothetical protein
MKMKKEKIETVLEEPIKKSLKPSPEGFDFDAFKFEDISDFEVYNKHVRAFNRTVTDDRKKMHIKVPDETFHKKIKIKFQRFDQPENVLKVVVRNKDIEWKGQLRPGGIYELPLPVVRFLNKLAVPIFAEVKVDDGGETKTETRQVGERARFSCQVLEYS